MKFELRYENPADNRRYIYHLEGERIRFQLVVILRSIHGSLRNNHIEDEISQCISETIRLCYNGTNTILH